MAVPQVRVSKSRKGKRRSHHHKKPIGVQYCPRCSEPVLPHRVCEQCGFYQGRDVLVITDEAQGK